MLKNLQESSPKTLLLQRNLFLVLSVFLALALFALSAVSFKKESITLFRAPQTKIDPLSIEKQGCYLAHLILSQSPETFSRQTDSLFEWVAPSFHLPLKRRLRKAKEKMTLENKSFEWELKDSAVELKDKNRATVFLTGELKAYIPTHEGNKRLIEKKSRSYRLEFAVSEGKPLLEDLELLNQEKIPCVSS